MWCGINNSVHGPTRLIAKMIDKSSQQGRTTNLRNTDHLWLLSDYSGEDRQSPYESYSFLVFDLASSRDFVTRLSDIRLRSIKDSRRVSYKNLREPVRNRAALQIAESASKYLVGNVVTIAVARSLGSLFKDGNDEFAPDPILAKYLDELNPRVSEKYGRILHFGAMVAAGFSSSGQNLTWITDRDEVVEGASRFTGFRLHAQNLFSHYLRHDMGHFKLGTSANDDGSMSLQDCLTVPDMAAGAMQEIVIAKSAANCAGTRLWSPLTFTKTLRASRIIEAFHSSLGRLSLLFFVIDKPSSGPGIIVSEERIVAYPPEIPSLWVPRPLH